MKNILFFRVWLEIVYLRRGGSFVGMIILGGCFGYWVLTQRSLLCRDDKVWAVGLFLTQRSLLRRDDNFGWVEGLLI